MCGRFLVIRAMKEFAKYFNARVDAAEVSFSISHNICPTELAPLVREVDGERALELGAFGIPTTIQGRTFPLLNLQSEKVENREDFTSCRCIIPADGFYEWEKVGPKDRQPHVFTPQSGFFSFAGVWKQTGTCDSR